MRLLFLLFFFLLSLRAHAAPLTLYTYDTFMAKGGLGPEVIPLFEKQCRCEVKALAVGDAAQIVTRLQLDEKRKKPTAHVVVGVDGPTWQLMQAFVEPWKGWQPKGYAGLKAELKRGEGFVPFDYGAMTFIQDNKQLKNRKLDAPSALEQLFDPKWRKNLILQDPRTSTPGMSFVLFIHALFSKDFAGTMKKLQPQWLTLAPGWDASYGMFLKEEAPLVWSYVTSQAYHEENGDKEGRFKAVVLEEGLPFQVEGAAMVKGAFASDEQRQQAKQFLEFLLTPEVQALIPKKNWMYPAVEKTPLPESFKRLPKVKKLVPISEDRATIEQVMKTWERSLY